MQESEKKSIQRGKRGQNLAVEKGIMGQFGKKMSIL